MTTRVGPSYQYNVLCDGCGFKLKNWQVKKRWDGFMMCKDCWEPRHPMDFFRSRNDVHTLPFTRSDNNGTDVGPTYTYPTGPDYTSPPGGVTAESPRADFGRAEEARLTS